MNVRREAHRCLPSRSLRTLLWAAACLAGAGCDETSGPDELDRPRILAVRVSPPGLAAAEVGEIDVLVGSAAGRVAVVQPARVRVEDARGPLPVDVISQGDQRWAVVSPPEATLADLRAALELDPDAPIPLRLAVDVEVDGEPLTATATKVVFLGRAGEGPTLAGISVGGAEVGEDGALRLRRADELPIAAEGAAGRTELSYSWYSSVGSVDLYRSERATLTADGPGAGQLVLVVGDQEGGVTWSWVDVQVL